MIDAILIQQQNKRVKDQKVKTSRKRSSSGSSQIFLKLEIRNSEIGKPNWFKYIAISSIVEFDDTYISFMGNDMRTEYRHPVNMVEIFNKLSTMVL